MGNRGKTETYVEKFGSKLPNLSLLTQQVHQKEENMKKI